MVSLCVLDRAGSNHRIHHRIESLPMNWYLKFVLVFTASLVGTVFLQGVLNDFLVGFIVSLVIALLSTRE